MNAPTRPALRWHGGKWMLAPWIISQMPAHRVYVEPYGGAASVLMRKDRSYAEVYNDLDGDVVNYFQHLRDPDLRDRLIDVIELTPFSEAEFQQSYDEAPDPLERARRLAVRSFMGFGSAGASGQSTGFRANSNRSGTTPAHDWVNVPTALKLIAGRLSGVVIHQRAALRVMAQHDSPETLHYVDPPYVPSTRDAGSDYRHEMTDGDHSEMLDALKALKGKVMLSGYPCDHYDEALPNWDRIERRALADGARERTEVLWLNFKPEPDLFSNSP
ncbi:MAG: DNA adenine methylase [Pikeienuella sp.]